MHTSTCPVILLYCISLLLCHSYSAPNTSTIEDPNEIDRLALLAIKSLLHDPAGVTISWNNSIPFCQWTGVTCGHRHRRVTELDLSNQVIGGHLSPFIGNLSFLRRVDLKDNNFYGKIPSEIGRLFKLQHLILSNNSFSGMIPTNLSHCSNLIQFIANKNSLIGEIPAEFSYLLNLEIFDVGYNRLTRQLPAFIGNLSALQLIDAMDNRLTGEIPDTIGHLTSLVELNLALNSLSGMVPLSIYNITSLKTLSLLSNRLSGSLPLEIGGEVPTKGVFSNTTVMSLNGNEKLCGGLAELRLPPCHHTKANHLKFLIPVIVMCMILSLAFFFVITRRRNSGQKHTQMSHMEEQFPMISYAALRKATNEFSPLNVIGQGSHGLVYKGILGENRKLVAVKVFKLQQVGAFKSFIVECEALRNIRHRNLIKIITTCSGIDFEGANFKALIYEYMQNGSLETWLHHHRDQSKRRSLSLIEGLDIVIDVASAVEYLHHYCQPPIIHGDLKPSNILLDQEMVAHVCDFGLAKFLSDNPLKTDTEAQFSSVGMKGTVGYIAPEYGIYGEFSMSRDVYSFGILLLELFTKKRPTDNMFTNGLTLHEFAKRALPERVMEIVEPSMSLKVGTRNSNVQAFTRQGEGRDRIEECLSTVLRIGVLCSVESPTERMNMTKVVAKLFVAKEKFLGGRI